MADDNKTVTVGLQLLYDPRSSAAFKAIAQELDKVARKAAEALAPMSGKGFRKEYRDAAGKLTGAANYETQAGLSARNIQDRRQAGRYSERQDLLGERAGIASQLGFGTAGGTMGRVGSFASGLQGAGFGGAAALAQRAALPLAIANTAAEAAEKAAGYHYDKYSSDSQKARGLFRDFVPGGERVQRFADAVTGRSADMEQNRINEQLGGADVRGRLQLAGFQQQWNPRQAGAEALAGAFRGQSAIAPSVFDRSTQSGEKAYREERILLPLKQAEAKAERDAAVAVKERQASQKELNTLAGKGNQLTEQAARLEKKLSGDLDTRERDQTLRQLQVTKTEVEGNLQLQRSGAEAVMGAKNKEVGTAADVARAKLRTNLLGKADVLDSRADTAQAAAGRLAGMDPFQRAFGLQAARLIKERGSTAGLPEDLIAAGIQFGGEGIQKIHTNTAAGTAEFKAGVSEFGFEGDPNKLRAEADAARKKAAEEGFKIDAEEAEKLAATGRDFGRFVGETMMKIVDEAKKEVIRMVMLGRPS